MGAAKAAAVWLLPAVSPAAAIAKLPPLGGQPSCPAAHAPTCAREAGEGAWGPLEESGKGGGSVRGALSLGEQLMVALPQAGVQHALKQDVAGVLHPAWLAGCCAVGTLTLVAWAASRTA